MRDSNRIKEMPFKARKPGSIPPPAQAAVIRLVRDRDTKEGEDTRGEDTEGKARNLTSKQERFAYLVGQEEKSFAGAYREAYETGKMSPETIQKKAWIEAHKDHVRSRIKELQEVKKKETPRDPARLKAFLVETLMSIAEDQREQTKDRTKAVELLGKTIGLFTEVVEHKGNTAPQSEQVEALRKRIEQLRDDK